LGNAVGQFAEKNGLEKGPALFCPGLVQNLSTQKFLAWAEKFSWEKNMFAFSCIFTIFLP